MSEQQNSAFGKFIPGFDFLQNLAKGASHSLPQMPNLSNWVAPTLNLEELEKRIGELKAVRFWLDQNAMALAATIQALEVQKMTLATLKGMNFNMADMADALKLKPGSTIPGAGAADQGPPARGAKPDGGPSAGAAPAHRKAPAGGSAAPGVVDPLQWWGALTQQFQQIAAGAMQDVAGAGNTTKTAGAPRPAAGTARGAARKTAGAKRPVRKAPTR